MQQRREDTSVTMDIEKGKRDWLDQQKENPKGTEKIEKEKEKGKRP
jgi:hypothetical protein